MSVIHSVRTRLLVCCVASIAVLGALVFAPAAGASNVGSTYLALGDSLAYGYHAKQFASEYPHVNPANYEEGYVNTFYNSLKAVNPAVTLVNYGCPGETTNTFDEGPGSPYPTSAYCAGGPTGGPFPKTFLHNGYSGTQLEAAEAFLKANPNTSPVTVDIGANDLLQFLEHTCGFPAEFTCTEAQIKTEQEQITGNVAFITGRLQKAAPHAQIIYLAIYNAYPLVLPPPGGDALVAQFNSLIANALAHSQPGTLFVNSQPLINPMTGGTELGDLPTVCAYLAMCPGPVGAVVPGSPYNPASPEADIHPTKLGYEKIGQLLTSAFVPMGGGGGGGATSCNGAIGGAQKGLTVPAGATCILMAGTKVSGNVQVQQGGSLVDEGAAISGNLQVNNGASIRVKGGGSIGGNLQVQGLTGGPNSLCNTIVHNDVQVQNNGSSSPIDIGNVGACAGGPGLTIGGNLQVQANEAKVAIGGNKVTGNIQIQNNKGGGTLSANSAEGNCELQNDKPPIEGSANTAGSGKTNTCNRNA